MGKTVIICSARQNENGGISGGQPGDQTGHEIERQAWYSYEPTGWVIIRPKSPAAAESIAWDMEAIADNDNIGYDQPRDQSLFKAAAPYGFDASKVKTPCDTDCAKAVRVSVLFAGIAVDDFYTATERKVLESTGAFDVIDDRAYTDVQDYLRRGDILVSRGKGHTAVVLTNGDKASTDPLQLAKYVEAKASIYLRESPRLSGKVLGYMRTGDIARYSGCYAVDMRGVVWYEIDNGDGSGLWASSAYAGLVDIPGSLAKEID